MPRFPDNISTNNTPQWLGTLDAFNDSSMTA
jgi:hypothetical protein